MSSAHQESSMSVMSGTLMSMGIASNGMSLAISNGKPNTATNRLESISKIWFIKNTQVLTLAKEPALPLISNIISPKMMAIKMVLNGPSGTEQ